MTAPDGQQSWQHHQQHHAPGHGQPVQPQQGNGWVLWTVAGGAILLSVLLQLVSAAVQPESWGAVQAVFTLTSTLTLVASIAVGVAIANLLTDSSGPGTALLVGGIITVLGVLLLGIIHFMFNPVDMTALGYSRVGIATTVVSAVANVGVAALVFGAWAKFSR